MMMIMLQRHTRPDHRADFEFELKETSEAEVTAASVRRQQCVLASASSSSLQHKKKNLLQKYEDCRAIAQQQKQYGAEER
jgi:hypothetical protein